MLDWKKTHPRGKWLIVKADPRVKTTKGGIILTEQLVAAERVMEGTGHILRVGSDREAILDATGGVLLEAGQRIFYRGFLKDAFHEFEVEDDGLAIFFLRAEDVMGLVEDGVQMGAFS